MEREVKSHACETPDEALPGETWTCPVCGKEWWANEIVFGLDGVFISWERVQ